jgi:NAD(P)-dependent dehydrogenase (short-subunit alcohol dehydrogenase family)
MELRGKTALVTGGAVRIGAEICLALAREGANVAVHYRSSAAEAEALCKKLAATGVKARSYRADLSDPTDLAKLVSSAGAVDILVNSAAVFHKDRIADVSAEKLLAEFWPNLFAPILLTRAFAAQGRRGAIVNILDRRITGHDTSCVPYLLAKKALAEFTALAALELAPRVTVNAVAPGPILPPPGKGGRYLKEKGGKVPLDVRFEPKDIAGAVLYLLKQDKMTGQVLFVDGGQHLLAAP